MRNRSHYGETEHCGDEKGRGESRAEVRGQKTTLISLGAGKLKKRRYCQSERKDPVKVKVLEIKIEGLHRMTWKIKNRP